MAVRAMKSPRPQSDSPSCAENPVIRVTSFSHDCRGVARLGGKAVFIDGALPGETVQFRYLRRQKRYDTAEVVEILEPSPNRVKPPCPHYGTCGGCSLQHLRPEVQLQAKQQILTEQLERLGKVKPESWLTPLTGPAFAYRRRARLGVRRIPRSGGVVVGFRQKNKSFLADLETCFVLEPKVSALLPPLHELIDGLSCPDRIPQIEVAGGMNATALVMRHLVPLTYEDRERLAAFGEANDIRIYLQPGRPDSVAPLWPVAPRPMYYRIPGFEVDIRFEPADFIQINDAVNNAMVKRVVELFELTPEDAVLDFFCGLGNFTLPLARRAARVLGVEGEKSLIERARANAQLNKMMNVEFVHADLYRESFNATWNHFRANKVLLDPPRSGAIEAIKSLVEPLPSRIVYVSCYPATLARDSEYLVQALGYRLAAVGVMDMFPQTNHVESIALFIKS